MAKQYQVTLPKAHEYPRHIRAGVEVLAGEEGYRGPLTDEQLSAIKADSLLTVKQVKNSDQDAEAKTTEKTPDESQEADESQQRADNAPEAPEAPKEAEKTPDEQPKAQAKKK